MICGMLYYMDNPEGTYVKACIPQRGILRTDVSDRPSVVVCMYDFDLSIDRKCCDNKSQQDRRERRLHCIKRGIGGG